MKLSKFKINNFRSIVEAECYVDLSLTILAGQNECGKSNILKALTKLTDRTFDDEDKPVGKDDSETRITYFFKLSEAECEIIKDKLELKSFDIADIIVVVNEDGLFFEWDDEKCNSLLKEKMISLLAGFLNKEQLAGLNSAVDVLLWIEEYGDIIKDAQEDATCLPIISEAINYALSFKKSIEDIISEMLPNVILYDSLTDMIPDSFKKDNLKDKSVKNLSRYIGYDFNDIFDETSTQKRVSKCKQISKKVSSDFCNIYHQNKVKIAFNYDSKEIYIYVHDIVNDDEGEPIKISQRSKGFAWYLGFYIALKGVDNKPGDIVLIDEPGLYLHPKAQEDMRAVLESLTEYQIIYTTHSPYLINTDALHRIRLVERNADAENDTIIKERIHAYNTEDTLKPIVDAIGYSIGSELNLNTNKILILEGVSDYYYLKAIEKILGKELDCNITYAKSADKIEYLISLYFGLGIEKIYVLVDSDKKGEKVVKDLLQNSILEADNIFYTEEPKDCDSSIEDLFEHDIFCKKILSIDSSHPKFTKKLSKIENSNGKFISAKTMYLMVCNGEIEESILTEKAKELFTNLVGKMGIK